jgi:rhodanese-related sulfurtransferase
VELRIPFRCIQAVSSKESGRVEIVTDPNRSIVVYGAGPESKEATVAGDELLRAGFTNIWEFAGGLEAWLEHGLATEGKPDAQEREQPASGSFRLTCFF